MNDEHSAADGRAAGSLLIMSIKNLRKSSETSFHTTPVNGGSLKTIAFCTCFLVSPVNGNFLLISAYSTTPVLQISSCSAWCGFLNTISGLSYAELPGNSSTISSKFGSFATASSTSALVIAATFNRPFFFPAAAPSTPLEGCAGGSAAVLPEEETTSLPPTSPGPDAKPPASSLAVEEEDASFFFFFRNFFVLSFCSSMRLAWSVRRHASPKSISFSSLLFFLVYTMFSSLMSRCAIPFVCRYSSADSTWIAMSIVCSSVNVRRIAASNKSPPRRISVTKYQCFGVWNVSTNVTMCGCRTVRRISSSRITAGSHFSRSVYAREMIFTATLVGASCNDT
mmetsp:Transcript_10559/g.22359  ORF Transcript_10559/g.22359 Transcript_10559/m.22359 type:complete len:339 (+) Transcript_10559:254-1270(+)